MESALVRLKISPLVSLPLFIASLSIFVQIKSNSYCKKVQKYEVLLGCVFLMTLLVVMVQCLLWQLPRSH